MKDYKRLDIPLTKDKLKGLKAGDSVLRNQACGGGALMKDYKRLDIPLTKDKLKGLKAGDSVLLNGVVYAARDAAHKKLIGMLSEGRPLPFDLRDQVIYYVGPCPERPGQVIGSSGPTTSSRMDAYAPELISRGLTGMIGKGLRSSEVVDAMIRHGSVYFGAIGGAGALIAGSIASQEIIAFPELGPEALRRLVVKDFPVIVVIDSQGNNLYETGKGRFRINV